MLYSNETLRKVIDVKVRCLSSLEHLKRSHFTFKQPLVAAQVMTANCWQGCFKASAVSLYLWEKYTITINAITLANLKRAVVCFNLDCYKSLTL